MVPITSLAFSSDGKRLVVGSSPHKLGYFNGARTSFLGYAPAVYSLWHSADAYFGTIYQRAGFLVRDGIEADVTMSGDTEVFAAAHEKGVDFFTTQVMET
jgi:hypothetical protein